MIIEIIKLSGGTLVPASDIDAEKLAKFKTGEQYQIEIKQTRNPAFHRKVFAFFQFCFEHWQSQHEVQCLDKQFDSFRDQMLILAGYYDELYNLSGEVRLEAKSLAYSSMSQEQFEQCYSALINVALKHIFTEDDPVIQDRLIGFF